MQILEVAGICVAAFFTLLFAIFFRRRLLMVRGGIPGHPGTLIMVRPTNKVGPGSPKAKTKKQEVVAKKK